ncbi:hypothetical protein [Pseudoalteromonas ardens]|uniref:Molecular chaperone DnaJ n=1 Tax=Pseudoalteromonas rubra TaxID=43658 RepID=A0A0L0EQ92_9GAMM|nr:hypothetical protein [Pseudoalteromonas sp. R96]KNC66662.1 molecular chaperone DnaJ [Pseudoalteromonas rubra]MDK1310997.1 molecular chaperone DnaJ [Pseudoalteromonas sp. R96]
MTKFVGIVLLTVLISACAATSNNELGYDGYNRSGETVEQTLLRLKEDSSVDVRNERGWTIATMKSGRVMWSFTPPNHPAHPSFVKREVIENDGRIYIETSARCGASKQICDDLVQDFIKLNNLVSKEMSGS